MPKYISEENLKQKLESLMSYQEDYELLKELIAECEELHEPWMTLDEFLRSGFVGKCWLGNNLSGAVTCAYYYSGAFCKDNSSCGPKYVSAQSVTHVMPIHKPEPPKL